jgi:hypothetical protein
MEVMRSDLCVALHAVGAECVLHRFIDGQRLLQTFLEDIQLPMFLHPRVAFPGIGFMKPFMRREAYLWSRSKRPNGASAP